MLLDWNNNNSWLWNLMTFNGVIAGINPWELKTSQEHKNYLRFTRKVVIPSQTCCISSTFRPPTSGTLNHYPTKLKDSQTIWHFRCISSIFYAETVYKTLKVMLSPNSITWGL